MSKCKACNAALETRTLFSSTYEACPTCEPLPTVAVEASPEAPARPREELGGGWVTKAEALALIGGKFIVGKLEQGWSDGVILEADSESIFNCSKDQSMLSGLSGVVCLGWRVKK